MLLAALPLLKKQLDEKKPETFSNPSVAEGVISLLWSIINIILLLRISPIHLFYNLQLIYWHFVERLWLFIYIVLYSY